jgi:hypothetical protein
MPKGFVKKAFKNAEVPQIESRFGKGKKISPSGFLGGGLFR